MYDVCVVYLVRERIGLDGVSRSEILLGEKRTGFGVGKLVGVGGKVETGETPEQTAVREVEEEIGVAIDAADLVAISRMTYPFIDRPEWSQRSFGFLTRRWSGEPTASDELAPRWFPLDDVPFDRMWADAQIWLPRALAGEFVEKTYSFWADGSLVDSS